MMVNICVLCGYVGVGISCHKFPKTIVRERWLAFVERHGVNTATIRPSICLCSAHFLPGDFKVTAVRRCLNPAAVPSLPVEPIAAAENIAVMEVLPEMVVDNGNRMFDMEVEQGTQGIRDIVQQGIDDVNVEVNAEYRDLEEGNDELQEEIENINDPWVDEDGIADEQLLANILNFEARCIAEIGSLAPQQFHTGPMNLRCTSCNARHFAGEQTSGHFSLCCGNGKILLTGDRALKPVPLELRQLSTEDSEEGRHYQHEQRQYNNSFAFASLVSHGVQRPPGPGPRVFILHGQMYNFISDAIPAAGEIPRFCQLYFVNTNEATEGRMQNPLTRNVCRPYILEKIDRLLRIVNRYVAIYKTMREVFEAERMAAAAENPPRTPRTVTVHFVSDNRDPRRYNLPAGNEVAAVFVGDNGNPPAFVDFVVHDRNPNPQLNVRRLQSTNRHADPMLYPLFFPYGELGWATHLPHEGPRRTARRTDVTMREFTSYRLAIRYNGLNEPDESFSAIHNGRFLLQQFVCDHYVRMEANNLNFIRLNQNRLRADTYQGLMDHLGHQDVAPNVVENVGRRVILPSTFQGGPRHMQQNYQDAMAIVRKYGKPDLFITFTCNPKWPEIAENLPRNVIASDRPDLVSRVFNLKLNELMDDVQKKKVFGDIEAFVYVVEFQKRGLPHAHILVILKGGFKLRNADDVDRFIRADIPNPATERRLHDIVTTNMMHGPCGMNNPTNTCMIDGKCSKNFPKAFTEETVYRNAGGYPAYRRPNNGLTVLVRRRELGNESVVPYNPYLLLKYNAHINVEVCSSIKSVMYLYKYVYKGHDAATLRVSSPDEVQRFIDTRYVSAPEAIWRLFAFHLHARSHVICRLAVHLENMQNVYFQDGQIEERVALAADRDTTLTGYFRLNVNDVHARQYLYHEIPNHYWWSTPTQSWLRRKNNTGQRVIGRMYSVSPTDRQRFYLRLLLLNKRGCVSFEDIRTVNDIVHPTYEAAAIALRLLENDNAWSDCLQEAALVDTPRQIRDLFATICVHCLPANPLQLYTTHEEHLMADMLRDRTIEEARSACLNAISLILNRYGKTLQDFNLPVPAVLIAPVETIYDPPIEAERGALLLEQLNSGQREVYNTVMAAVIDDRQVAKVFFVDGPGGTGKTTLYSCLMSVLRGQGKSVLAVAFTGIAATLLDGGRTVHSTFGLPFGTLTEISTSTIKLQSQRANRIRNAALVVWDEAPMSPSLQLSVVDRLLRDIMQSELPFGGKPFLFGGDFRQILPVVRHGTRSDIVNACIKTNSLWPRMRKFALTRNMRADGDRQFAAWLLMLGNGHVEAVNGYTPSIRIPEKFVCRGSIIDFVFPGRLSLNNLQSYANNVILCPLNDDCRVMNDSILRDHVEGLAQQYLSIDSVVCDDPEEASDYPMEFIHSLDLNGVPPHNLILKVGAVVMLLRNLDPNRGLCNGTRLVVTELRRFNFKARFLNATNTDEDFIIPNIPLTTSEEDGLPFTLRRVQFPVRLAFSVTINKSQGQTFNRIGLYLPSPVFTHGQLYVAFSRVRNADSVRVQLPVNADSHYYTDNVVFREVL